MFYNILTMKGSVSRWIWVVGCILAGLIIFAISYAQLRSASLRFAEKRTFEQFHDLKTQVNDICWSNIGNVENFEIKLADITEAVYTHENERGELDNLYQKVLNNEISDGNHICIKMEASDPLCEELDCNVTMPFIGQYGQRSAIRTMIDDIRQDRFRYTFGLNISKTARRNVTVDKVYP